MATTRRTIIELLFDGSQATAATLKLGRDVDNLDVKVEEARRGWTRFGTAMNVALGNLAAQGALAAARALGNLARKGIRELNDSLRLAGIQDIANRKLESALKNLAPGAEAALPALRALAEEVQSYSNFGDEAIITAQAFLASFKEVGGPDGIATLTPRLVDVAAGMAKVTGETVDLNTVAQLMGRALTTGAGALTRVGVSLSEAQQEAFNAASGLERVNILAEILDGNFKGLAEATADPFVQLDNAIGDLKETIGQAILPVVREFATEIKEFAESDDAQRLADQLGTGLADALTDVGNLVRENGPTIIEFFRASAELLPVIVGAGTKAANALLTVKTLFDLNTGQFAKSFEDASAGVTAIQETVSLSEDATTGLAAGLRDVAAAAASVAETTGGKKDGPDAEFLRAERVQIYRDELYAMAEAARQADFALLDLAEASDNAFDLDLGPLLDTTDLLEEDLNIIGGDLDTIGEKTIKNFADIGVPAFVAFGEAAVEAAFNAGDAIGGLKAIFASVFTSILRQIASSLIASAAAAAFAGDFGKAARLGLAAGAILGGAAAIDRLGNQNTTSEGGSISRGAAITSAGNSIIRAGGGQTDNVNPNAGNTSVPSEILLRAHGSELRGVIAFEEAQLSQVRRI